MSDDRDEIAQLLREIRDGQRAQLELQREQLAIYQCQAERADRINDRTEQLQAGSAQIMGVARKTLFVVLPVLVLLIAYVTWLIFR